MRDRRRKRVEARVADESGPLVAVWFNQPWIARQLGEGSQVLLHGKLRKRGEFWVSRARAAGVQRRAASTRSASCPCIRRRRASARAELRELMSDARGRSCWRLPSRCRRRCGWPSELPDRAGRAVRRALPRERGRRAAGAPPARLRGAAPAPARGGRAGGAPGGEARKARPLAARGVVVDRWRWSLPFELTGGPGDGDGGDRRRPRPGAADAAAADGRGGQRARPWSRWRRCCAPSRTAPRQR